MFRKILKGYITVLWAVFRFLLLLAVCVGAGAVIVWPLWKLADSNPSAYTLVFTLLFLAITGFIVGSRIRLSIRRDPRRFLLSLARKLTIIAGILIPVALVLARQRAAALIAFLAAFALYGFLAFGLTSGKSSSVLKS